MKTDNSVSVSEAFAPEVDERAVALSEFLECDADECEQSSYCDEEYDAPGGTYLVLTDSEADEKCKEYIRESLWAFNASFLGSMTGIDEEMFSGMQDKCEGANDAFLRVVESTCGLDEFVEQATSADGRGHFLAGYDGDENERGEYFIYRTN